MSVVLEKKKLKMKEGMTTSILELTIQCSQVISSDKRKTIYLADSQFLLILSSALLTWWNLQAFFKGFEVLKHWFPCIGCTAGIHLSLGLACNNNHFSSWLLKVSTLCRKLSYKTKYWWNRRMYDTEHYTSVLM